MTRVEALRTVALATQRIGDYSAVSVADAKSILGDERFSRMAADPVRKHGPQEGFVYSWNVVDYLHHPDLRKPAPQPPKGTA